MSRGRRNAIPDIYENLKPIQIQSLINHLNNTITNIEVSSENESEDDARSMGNQNENVASQSDDNLFDEEEEAMRWTQISQSQRYRQRRLAIPNIQETFYDNRQNGLVH